MIGLLVVWVVQGVLLTMAVGLVGPGGEVENTFGRAFVVAAVLSAVAAALGELGLPGVVGAVAWLAVVKQAYAIGWWRALGVWLMLVVVTVAVSSLLGLLGLVALGTLVVAL